ncbi:Holliday junction resolvase RecU [Priestia endophytica]
MVQNAGKLLEQDFQQSAKDQKLFFYRIKDVPRIGSKVTVGTNKYDSFVYKKPHLLPLELKSTKGKSFSFSESIIKAHQIKALKEAVDYEGVVAGFIFNFREPNNDTYFVHIDDFIQYKNHVEGNDDSITYQSKTNEKSIPIAICAEIGIPIKNMKKRVRYRYYINKLIDDISERYGQQNK